MITKQHMEIRQTAARPNYSTQPRRREPNKNTAGSVLSAVPPTSVCVDINKKQLSMTIPVSTPPQIVPAVRTCPNCPLLTMNRLKNNIPRNGLVQHTPPPNMVCPANTVTFQSLPTRTPLKDPYLEASTHQRTHRITSPRHRYHSSKDADSNAG